MRIGDSWSFENPLERGIFGGCEQNRSPQRQSQVLRDVVENRIGHAGAECGSSIACGAAANRMEW